MPLLVFVQFFLVFLCLELVVLLSVGVLSFDGIASHHRAKRGAMVFVVSLDGFVVEYRGGNTLESRRTKRNIKRIYRKRILQCREESRTC